MTNEMNKILDDAADGDEAWLGGIQDNPMNVNQEVANGIRGLFHPSTQFLAERVAIVMEYLHTGTFIYRTWVFQK
jgi:hypothetical protein